MKSLDFLNQFESRSTVQVHVAAVKKFLETIYGAETEPLQEYADRFLQERDRDRQRIMEGLQAFAAQIKDSHPKTRRTYLAAVKIFLLENEYREFKQQTLQEIVELKRLIQRIAEGGETLNIFRAFQRTPLTYKTYFRLLLLADL